MNSTKNKPPFPISIPRPVKQPSGQAHLSKPQVTQLKRGVAPQAIKPPVPPAPRVNPPPRAVPPTYPPQPLPKVLQKKSLLVQRPQISQRNPSAVQVKPATPVRLQSPTSKAVQIPNTPPSLVTKQPASTVLGSGAGTIGGGAVIQQARPKTGRSRTAAPARTPAPSKKAPAGRKTTAKRRTPPATTRRVRKPQRQAKVTLKIGRGTRPYDSSSSGQYGHAEMAALRKFIVSYKTVAKASEAFDRLHPKIVTCPNQPVCLSCSMILQALGFQTGRATTFGTKKSGGVAWGANMKVREFMAHRNKLDVYLSALSAGAK
jgi:hypothetical protein